MIFIAGCAPPKRMGPPIIEEIEAEFKDVCPPHNLTVKPGDGSLHLRWEIDCPESTLLSGYYIYVLDKPIYDEYHSSDPPSSARPYNDAVYPGDTVADRGFETITISDLDNGVDYYLSVRTVYPDRKISASSNEIGVICRPEGQFELAFRYAALNDGFSFARAASVRADGTANDLVFYNKDNIDFIECPSRLNGFLRKTEIYSLGKTKDIYQYPKFTIDIPPEDKLPIFEGESYLIRTADGNYAKIRIEKISGSGKERILKIRYIYQTLKGVIRF